MEVDAVSSSLVPCLLGFWLSVCGGGLAQRQWTVQAIESGHPAPRTELLTLPALTHRSRLGLSSNLSSLSVMPLFKWKLADLEELIHSHQLLVLRWKNFN